MKRGEACWVEFAPAVGSEIHTGSTGVAQIDPLMIPTQAVAMAAGNRVQEVEETGGG